jgi:hypothetical protein
MSRKRKPSPKPADLLKAFADDTSLTPDEKLSLARTLAGELPPRKAKDQQVPDWLEAKFDELHTLKHKRQHHKIRRRYWAMVAVFTLIVLVSLWATFELMI